MLISTPEDIRNTGLEQFASIRTPSSRSSTGDGWWWWKSGGETRRKGAHSRNTSQQSLRREINPPASDNCIHMDVITAVVVEENTDTMTDTIHSTSISTNGKKTEEYMSDVSMARS
ncbi:integral membrane protein [Seiridium cupressi]